jgi:hypothetical protein
VSAEAVGDLANEAPSRYRGAAYAACYASVKNRRRKARGLSPATIKIPQSKISLHAENQNHGLNGAVPKTKKQQKVAVFYVV